MRVRVLKTHRIYGRYADLLWQKYLGGISLAYEAMDLQRCETDSWTKAGLFFSGTSALLAGKSPHSQPDSLSKEPKSGSRPELATRSSEISAQPNATTLFIELNKYKVNRIIDVTKY